MNIAIRDHLVYADGKKVVQRTTPNRGGALRPEGVVLHDTAGGLDAAGSIAWLCNPTAKASAHVVVARDGTITQLAPLNVVTWHAGQSNWKGRPNVNGFAVGIEIVNPGLLAKIGEGRFVNGLKVAIKEDADHVVRAARSPAHGDGFWLDYTAAQVDTVIALCAAIRSAYGIAWIGTHWEISPGRKIDTSPLFPLETVRARVFGRATATAAGAKKDAAADSTGTVVVASLNLRGGPGVSHSVIRGLPRGTRVQVRAAARHGDDMWLRVDALGKSGWVAARYVDLN